MIIELSVVSADTKRKELEAYRAKKEAERIAYEAQRNQRVERLVEHLFNEAKEGIERFLGLVGWYEVTIYEDDLKNGSSLDELRDAVDIVSTLLGKAGYKVNDLYVYSSSWRRKSGKVACLGIRL